MPRLHTRILLFCSSYAPLFAILAFKVRTGHRALMWIFGAVAVISSVGLWLYAYYWLPRKNTIRVTPPRVTPKDNDAVSYFVFYLFPFLDITLTTKRLS